MPATADLISADAQLLEAAKLALKRLCELNRDDESGIRIVLDNAIKRVRQEKS